tara:strand:- start:161 stop:535 length:375 start_codon:yes stop_codon:yes gene_type:complete
MTNEEIPNPYEGIRDKNELIEAVASDAVGASMQLAFSNHSGPTAISCMWMVGLSPEEVQTEEEKVTADLIREMKEENWEIYKILSLVYDIHEEYFEQVGFQDSNIVGERASAASYIEGNFLTLE